MVDLLSLGLEGLVAVLAVCCFKFVPSAVVFCCIQPCGVASQTVAPIHGCHVPIILLAALFFSLLGRRSFCCPSFFVVRCCFHGLSPLKFSQCFNPAVHFEKPTFLFLPWCQPRLLPLRGWIPSILLFSFSFSHACLLLSPSYTSSSCNFIFQVVFFYESV